MSEKRRPTHSALIELTIIRLKELIREPDAIFWIFVFPLLLTVALGFAFREKPPDRIPVGIVEGLHASERLASLKKSPALQPRVYSPEQGREELRRGKISLLVEEGPVPTYRFDPTRPESRGVRMEVDTALQFGAGRRDPFAPKEIHSSEQGSRYIDFLVPGLIGMNIMGTGMWGIGFATVNARLRKLLKRLVATPMRKTDYLFSQLLARMFFLVVEVTVVGVFAWLVFDVSVRGSLVTFALVCTAGAATFAAFGVLIASRAQTIEVVTGLMNAVMMPMWIGSGVFFSYERFPEAVLPLIRVLPLTALIDALRAVMNDAAGLATIAPQMIILLVWTVISAAAGLKLFRWQ